MCSTENTLELKLIGFYYRSFKNSAVSYDNLSEHMGKDVAFFMLNTERADLSNNGISTAS